MVNGGLLKHKFFIMVIKTSYIRLNRIILAVAVGLLSMACGAAWGQDNQRTPLEEFAENYRKFNNLAANGEIAPSNAAIAMKYIDRCLELNDTDGTLGDRGKLLYMKSIVYKAQRDTLRQFWNLKNAVSCGYYEASTELSFIIDEIENKKIVPLIEKVNNATGLANDQNTIISPSALRDINECIRINDQYDGIESRALLYFMKAWVYYFSGLTDENTQNFLNYLMMSYNKNPSIAQDLITEFSSSKDFDNGILNPYSTNSGYVVDAYLPTVNYKSSNLLTVKRVYVTDYSTVVNCVCRSYGWMSISPTTYILANGHKYPITGARGIPFSPERYYFDDDEDSANFFLFFPVIPFTTKSIDLIEFEGQSPWQVKGIILR